MRSFYKTHLFHNENQLPMFLGWFIFYLAQPAKIQMDFNRENGT